MAAARPSAETLNAAANLPLSPNEQNTLLGGPPRASFFAPTEATLTPQHSGTFGSPLLKQGADNEALTPAPITAKPKPGKRWFIIAALLAAVGLLIIVIIVPVYFTVIRPKEGGGKENAVTSHHGSSSSAGSNGSPSPTSSGNHPESPDRLITGGDKSTVTKDDGTTFVYNNQFGGYCKWRSLFSFRFPLEWWAYCAVAWPYRVLSHTCQIVRSRNGSELFPVTIIL